MAIWAMGPLLGPVVGPVAGGFLAQAEGWRWIFWVIAIAIGVMTIAGFFALEETYAPTLLERKTKKLRKETGNPRLRSKLDQQLPAHELFLRAIVRPTKLLFRSPICALMSLYMAFVYAILYLLFTTFTFVFEDHYGFSPGTVGLVYIGCGIGMLLGLAILGGASDPLMQSLARKHNEGKVKPEYRLPMLIYAGPTIPAGLFLYGWTAQYHVSRIPPTCGTIYLLVCRLDRWERFTDGLALDPMGGPAARYAVRGHRAHCRVHVHQHLPGRHVSTSILSFLSPQFC